MLFGFASARLGTKMREHAVLVLGGRLVRLEGGGEGEAPGEHAVSALDPVVALALVLTLELPLAADGQHAVLEANVDVLRIHLGEIELEGHALDVLEDVGRGGPAVRLLVPGKTDAAVEQPVHFVLQTREIARRVPALHAHDSCLPLMGVPGTPHSMTKAT